MNSPLAASAHLDELVDCFATSYKTALTIGSGNLEGIFQIKTKIIMQFRYFLKTVYSVLQIEQNW